MLFYLALAGFLSAAGITAALFGLIWSEANAERRARKMESNLAAALDDELQGAVEGRWPQ